MTLGAAWSNSPTYHVHLQASSAHLQRQAELVEKMELQRKMRSLVVPTNDREVRMLLRQLGEPITLFGEREVRGVSIQCSGAAAGAGLGCPAAGVPAAAARAWSGQGLADGLAAGVHASPVAQTLHALLPCRWSGASACASSWLPWMRIRRWHWVGRRLHSLTITVFCVSMPACTHGLSAWLRLLRGKC